MAATRRSSALTDHVGYWMRLVSNHVSHSFARRLEALGVTVAEWVVMRELHDATSTSPSRLAERLAMTRGAISKLAERLIAKGLVVRTETPGDGRGHTLRLSSRGLSLIPRLARAADENDAECFGYLSDQERRALRNILEDVARRRGLKDVPVS